MRQSRYESAIICNHFSKKTQTSGTFVGTGQCRMVATFDERGWIFLSRLNVRKTSRMKFRRCISRVWRKMYIVVISQSFVKCRIWSFPSRPRCRRETTTNFPRKSRRIRFIKVWNETGALQSPNSITLYWNFPSRMLKGGFFWILFGYQHLMVTLRKIEFRQHLRSIFEVEIFLNPGKGIAVLRNGIQRSEINAHPPFTSRLLRKQDRKPRSSKIPRWVPALGELRSVAIVPEDVQEIMNKR